MSEMASTDHDRILGMTVEEASDTVLERRPDTDREAIESALEIVAAEGTITAESVDAAIGDGAQHVATPENRLELTREALESAEAAAVDLDIVHVRLEELRGRFRDLEKDVDELISRLDDLVSRAQNPEDIYDLAVSIRDLKWDTRDVHGRAERLRTELESFERWAADPTIRFDELDGELEHVTVRLDELKEAIERLEAAEATDRDADPAVAWANAIIQRRVIGLLLADLRTELTDLRAWEAGKAETSSEDEGEPAIAKADQIEARLDELESRERRLEERLSALDRPEWRARIGDHLDAFDAEFEAFGPPVNWSAVQSVVERHRAALREEC